MERWGMNPVVQRIVTYGLFLVFLAGNIVAGKLLDRKQPSWRKHFAGWVKRLSRFQRAGFGAILYFAYYALVGLLVLSLHSLNLLPPELSSSIITKFRWWLVMSILMGVGAFGWGMLDKPHVEPEDWLLWNKEGDPQSSPSKAVK